VFFRFKGFVHISRLHYALAFTFLVLPFVYAFGSNINSWYLAARISIFWVLAGLIFLSPIKSRRHLRAILLPLGLAAQMTAVLMIQASIVKPFRQPGPLWENDYQIEFREPGSTLVVSNDFGQYITKAINLAKQAGFEKGTPMIDMSGQSPGILYAIGANSIGQAWHIGGYKGSNEVEIEMLKKVSCEDLSRAWLLAEPEGPRALSTEVLSSFGAGQSEDYEVVGSLRTAQGISGWYRTPKGAGARLQHFLKPARSNEAAIAACKAERAPSK
jgi:hypothetical protein